MLGARPDLDAGHRGPDQRARRSSYTIVIVTHNMQQAGRVSDLTVASPTAIPPASCAAPASATACWPTRPPAGRSCSSVTASRTATPRGMRTSCSRRTRWRGSVSSAAGHTSRGGCSRRSIAGWTSGWRRSPQTRRHSPARSRGARSAGPRSGARPRGPARVRRAAATRRPHPGLSRRTGQARANKYRTIRAVSTSLRAGRERGPSRLLPRHVDRHPLRDPSRISRGQSQAPPRQPASSRRPVPMLGGTGRRLFKTGPRPSDPSGRSPRTAPSRASGSVTGHPAAACPPA